MEITIARRWTKPVERQKTIGLSWNIVTMTVLIAPNDFTLAFACT
jgi:hypothetical protein